MPEVGKWARVDPAGKDTYWHLRPRHVTKVLGLLLDAQLREPTTTALTVVTPWVNNRKWRKYLKHFRRQVPTREQCMMGAGVRLGDAGVKIGVDHATDKTHHSAH